MRKKRSKKIIYLIIALSILIISSIICIIKLTSYSVINDRKTLFVNSNVISFGSTEDNKYIHLILKKETETPVTYNVINPSGKVVKTDELIKSSDFFCDSEKGIWKITFDVSKDVIVDYKVWEGNLKLMDTIK